MGGGFFYFEVTVEDSTTDSLLYRQDVEATSQTLDHEAQQLRTQNDQVSHSDDDHPMKLLP